MTKAVLGIIGGSGIYDLRAWERARGGDRKPWASRPAPVRRGPSRAADRVLPRHDKGHRLSPSDINYRANIRRAEARRCHRPESIVGLRFVSRKNCRPARSCWRPVIDRTHKRESSFFGRAAVAHVSMAHPVSPRLAHSPRRRSRGRGIAIARGGTYVCIEGPQSQAMPRAYL